jgi:hypothetical protein
MVDRGRLRRAGGLLVVGELSFIGVGLLHPGREAANAHRAVFAEYAASGNWTAVHLGQFLATAVIIAGLLALLVALADPAAGPGFMARLAAMAAGVALALTGVLQAVDGVVLKQAVDAWARAPAGEQATAFANAELVRWLEWGMRSYQRGMLGLTFLLVGAVIAATSRLPKPVGGLAGLVGVSYLAQAWIVGTEGFSAAAGPPTLVGLVLELGWSLWIAGIAWRLPPVHEQAGHASLEPASVP